MEMGAGMTSSMGSAAGIFYEVKQIETMAENSPLKPQ